METALAIVAVWFLLILICGPLAGFGLRLLGRHYPVYDQEEEFRG